MLFQCDWAKLDWLKVLSLPNGRYSENDQKNASSLGTKTGLETPSPLFCPVFNMLLSYSNSALLIVELNPWFFKTCDGTNMDFFY